MGEHLDRDQLAPRTADVVLDDLAADGRHLFERQLARQHHRIGPLGVEAHRLRVGDVALRRDVHLLPDAAGIEDRRHVGGDHGVDPFGLRPVDHLVHGAQLILVDHRVDREVGLDTVLFGDRDDPREVVEREVRGRSRAHVEFADPEIDGVRPGVDRRGEGFVRPHGGHDFYIVALHDSVKRDSTPARSTARGGRKGSARRTAPDGGRLREKTGVYFLRPISPAAYSRSICVRAGSTESPSSIASARSKRSPICCSVSRGTSRRS